MTIFSRQGVSATGKRAGFILNLAAIGVRNQEDTLCKRIHFLKFTGGKDDPKKHGAFNDPGKFQEILQISLSNFVGQRAQFEKRFEIHDDVCLKEESAEGPK